MIFDTDKIEPHQYFRTYAEIAGKLGPKAKVCELGVLDGESLRMFQALFPLGNITGVDINGACTWPEGTGKIIAPHSSPLLPGLLGGLFDLIVDDGCHNGLIVEDTFELLWPLVAPGGFYVIEDWQVSLRSATRPGETWGDPWGPEMLGAVQELLRLLDYPDAECDEITYRYGLAIVHRRK